MSGEAVAAPAARLVGRLRHAGWLGLAGALLAWLDIGVAPTGPDQQLYIPYVRHFAHPELYRHDWIFDSDNYRATLWVPLVGGLHRLLGGPLEPLLLVVHGLSLVVLFSGLAAATARVTRGAAPAWVVAFLSWPPPVPGAAAALWEPSPHPRTLAVGLAVWSLRWAIDGQALPAAALAALATLVHPLLGAAAVVGVALALLDDRRALGQAALLVAILVGAAHLAWPAQRSELPLGPVDWWRDVATASFLWFGEGQPAILLSLAAWLGLLGVAAWAERDAAARRLLRFGLAGALLLAAAFAGMRLRSPLLVSLQLHRGQYVLMVAAVLFTARRLERAVADGRLPWPVWAAVAMLPFTHSLVFPFCGLGLALAWPRRANGRTAWSGWVAAGILLAVVALRFRPHRVSAAPNDDWLALGRWAAQETPTDALFLAPPRVPDFRVFSARASVLGVQDQQPTIFNHALALAWQARRHILDGYAQADCFRLTAEAMRFSATHLVTGFDCPLSLIHQEGRFRVYAVPPRR